jgi:tRNA pseudouridine38-40 synthase
VRAYRLAYDGTDYRGFQRQPHGQTVEDKLFQALSALDIADGKPERYAAAGRTDRGVSAIAQTVAFAAPQWLTPQALNSRLPDGILAWASTDVDTHFSARHDAVERRYMYHLYLPSGDLDHATDACVALSGRHNFHNLTLDSDGTVRDMSVTAEQVGRFIMLDLRAPGFARQLVRRVAMLVELVARGEYPVTFVDRALAAEPLPGEDGIPPAPPEGLVLRDVRYPNRSFEIDQDALESVRTLFDRRQIDAATRAQTFESMLDVL